MQNQESEATRYSTARSANDFKMAGIIAGEAVDLVTEILPAAEIVERTVTEASRLISGASNRHKITG